MCVTKVHHVVILRMLKIYLLKSQGNFEFKSGKSGKSQGIFAPDMAGNPDISIVVTIILFYASYTF